MNPRTDFLKGGVSPNYTLSNRYNSADLMILFKNVSLLALIIRTLSCNSNTTLLFSLVSKVKLSKDGKWLQSNK